MRIKMEDKYAIWFLLLNFKWSAAEDMNGPFPARVIKVNGAIRANVSWKKSLNSIWKKKSLENKKNTSKSKKKCIMMQKRSI